MKTQRPNLTTVERNVLRRLTSPQKIQDFLNTLTINFEDECETCMSPRRVLASRRAHCLEGALFAAAALWYNGHPPLLLDLKASKNDFDHVVALFKIRGKWGAISKTNHAVLRYREPVYRSVRELALSYFHEYFTDTGIKTLRSHSGAFSLKKFGSGWLIAEEELWDIGAALDDARHFPIITPARARALRKADPIEIEAGRLVQYKQSR